MSIEIVEGSIVTLEVDAIVNAANATLAGGGGVDGAIQSAAGPELKAGEPELLARCYRSVLAEVDRLGISSVAFPAISTGAFGYPADAAAKIAVREVKAHAKAVRVIFACLGIAMVRRYERALREP